MQAFCQCCFNIECISLAWAIGTIVDAPALTYVNYLRTELSKNVQKDHKPHKRQTGDQDCRWTHLQAWAVIRVKL
jgi:hypothetical protein